MALNQENLVPLAGFDGDGPRLWSYKTPDALTDLEGADYFLLSIGDLKIGDWIVGHTEIDAAAGSSTVDLYVVITNDGSTISVGGTQVDLGT